MKYSKENGIDLLVFDRESELEKISKNHPDARLIEMHILDIGGGFPGDNSSFFIEIANVINQQIKQKFPSNVKIIGEPGRFLVTSCTTLVTRIISAEHHFDSMCYFTNEGIYGALNILHFEDPNTRGYEL